MCSRARTPSRSWACRPDQTCSPQILLTTRWHASVRNTSTPTDWPVRSWFSFRLGCASAPAGMAVHAYHLQLSQLARQDYFFCSQGLLKLKPHINMTNCWEPGSGYAILTCGRSWSSKCTELLLQRDLAFKGACIFVKTCTVLQDKKHSDPIENAMTVMQINPILKTAMRQLKGIRLEQTEEEVVLVLLSRFSWFKACMHACYVTICTNCTSARCHTAPCNLVCEVQPMLGPP